jgi:hypothetical protein
MDGMVEWLRGIRWAPLALGLGLVVIVATLAWGRWGPRGRR